MGLKSEYVDVCEVYTCLLFCLTIIALKKKECRIMSRLVHIVLNPVVLFVFWRTGDAYTISRSTKLGFFVKSKVLNGLN